MAFLQNSLPWAMRRIGVDKRPKTSHLSRDGLKSTSLIIFFAYWGLMIWAGSYLTLRVRSLP